MSKLRVGLALTGSYCTFEKTMIAAEELCRDYDILPIMSENACSTDTRFGRAADFIERLEKMSGKRVLREITQVEPIGPKDMLDVLLIAPCTGNTLGKLSSGITDTCVTMAAKSQLRVNKPVLLAVSTNDALSGSAVSIGNLLQRKNVYFVPFYQDDPEKKPASLVSDYSKLRESIELAYQGHQIQPILARV